jgi:uncharacterized damage-inducible protein DinB
MRNLTGAIGVLVAGLSVAAMAQAQAPRSPGGAGQSAVADAIRSSWNSAKKNVKESADVQEMDFAFKPTADVRSFGAILSHLAGANYVFCAAAKGEKAPHAEDEFEKSATTRPAIVKALNDSLTYCDSAFAPATDRTLADVVDQPFGGPPAARAQALLGQIGHTNEHYGNLVTYFRLKGIVPPSSRR